MIHAGLTVRAFFTSREGGVSHAPYASLNVGSHVGDDPAAVEVNRALVAEQIGAPVAFVNGEHGIRVHHVTDPRLPVPVADILITTTEGVALAALAADCTPLLLHDRATGAVVAAHIGREGLYRGAVDAAVAALLDLRDGHADPGLLEASIGPAICGDCYEVPADLQRRVADRHPVARAVTSWGTPALDIPRAIETRLGELGFIDVVHRQACTFEDPTLFSHRRDGVTGRQCGVIVCGGVSLP